MAVAAALDGLSMPSIVGSLAGDDTVFCAAKSADAAEEVIKRIKELIR